MTSTHRLTLFLVGTLGLVVLFACGEHAKYWRGGEPRDTSFIIEVSDPAKAHERLVKDLSPAAPKAQSAELASAASAGCISCHGETDEPDMHPGRKLAIGCVDCHGGNATVMSPMAQPGRPGEPGTVITDSAYLQAMHAAHVQPRNPEAWYGTHDLNDAHPRKFGQHSEHGDALALHGSRNPEITFALLNQESPQFIRFINPGDLRVADFACGACHAQQVADVRHSMMTHGAMLWTAVLYNNGGIPNKLARYGESYNAYGIPQRVQGVIEKAAWDADKSKLDVVTRWPTRREVFTQGVLPYLDPLPTWNVSQPGNILRIFERGTKLPVPGGPTPNPNPAEIGNPNALAEGGRPDKGLSPRGLGTFNRTDPVFIGIQKTRLLDPLLSFAGTNDHPGDFRASGCTACHTPYANDRDPFHSGQYASFGHMGQSASVDPTLPKDRSGHPIKHVLTTAIPNAQCVTCHIHPGTSYANTYLGYMWWDNESDGEQMYPSTSRKPTEDQEWKALRKNPDSAQLKGLWGNLYPDATSHTGDVSGEKFLQKIGQPRASVTDPLADRAPRKADASDSSPREWRGPVRGESSEVLGAPEPAKSTEIPAVAAHADAKALPTVDDGSVFNDKLRHNQFADFHGHGWVFRAVHKKDRQGRLLDREGNLIDPDDPQKWTKAVHLKDVHLEAGMHCIDCHFEQDAHGNGKLYSEPRNAIEITCIDCHGTYDKYTNLRTSGPAAPRDDKGAIIGTDLSKMTIGPKRQKRFEWKSGKLMQRSSMNPDVQWEVVQTLDTINPTSAWSAANPEAAKHSRYAKTIRRDGKTWGDLPPAPAPGSSAKGDAKDPGRHEPARSESANRADELAHSMNDMECFTCHTSWMTSCFGCHLPMEANHRTPMLHNESKYTRNYTRYNFQVLRDDVFMLGRDGSVRSGGLDEKGNAKPGKIVPVRSSSAVLVSSQNQNREWVYSQQQTVSAEGYSGQAFNPHFPHATGGRGTTKMCTDCHLANDNSNNAWMAQLLLQGTNFVNFLGRYVYVATGKDGLEAVVATERDEPQAVYGSHLHQLAYPDEFKKFVEGQKRELKEAYHHDAGWGNEILDLQLRGEYLYAARGKGGFYAYDVANIDNKGFSERIVTAPVSPVGGQRLGFDTKYAVAIASPATVAVDPARARLSNDPSKPYANVMAPPEPWHVNQEQPVHPLYAYLYIGDREEGLVLTFAATLLDGDPTNNFMTRATLDDGTGAFNPEGALDGVTHLVVAGHHLYITAAKGLFVIDIDKPTAPKIVASLSEGLRSPRSVAVQFRYAFITDADGLKVVDITDPTKPALVSDAKVELADAQRVYVARTYAFVAAGSQGLAIVDVTNPRQPRLDQVFNAAGAINDARDVKVGMTNASLYAYVADGRNGLRVLQLMGPESTPQFRGFQPPLSPTLIATYHTHGPALAVSKGLDRDRAVDESGHQVAVFGRWGARPLNLLEMQRMYLRDGQVWSVTNEPATQAAEWTFKPAGSAEPSKPAPGSGANRPGPQRPGPRPGPGGPPR
jgi:hypothetical protein